VQSTPEIIQKSVFYEKSPMAISHTALCWIMKKIQQIFEKAQKTLTFAVENCKV